MGEMMMDKTWHEILNERDARIRELETNFQQWSAEDRKTIIQQAAEIVALKHALTQAEQSIVLLDKQYVGFEAMVDIARDVMEAFDEDFTPAAKTLSGEYQGTVRVRITHTPE